ncbi:MAG: acyl-CoA reductase-like NAD-dependent aldehyde dehydrogenase [Phenylobacterium sp.]|jgi:acyl-CoA reductase-like NAD-dependent aldehyde dehydrogenase
MTERLKSYNPANGELVGEVAVTPITELPGVVIRAHAAGKKWCQFSLEQRGDLLKQAGQVLMQNANTLGQLLSDEMGKPVKNGISEVNFCGRAMAKKVDSICAALQPEIDDSGPMETAIYYDALGVCAAISPWNFPMSMPQTMVIPALMAGNSVILKPSEETPLIAQAYVDALNQFLPPDVLQIVHGDGVQGKALVKADVNLIAFTGSRAAGTHIMAQASHGLKRVMLELGGKDPLIVLDDADIEQAAKLAVSNSFENAGQICVSTERIFVSETIATAFEQRVAQLSADITTGPMIHQRQRQHVLDQINSAVAQGARQICGPDEHPPRYVIPTVLADVNDDMDIMQSETFGPVACISRFSDIDEVIKRANNSDYALGAAVFGQDEDRAYAVARQLTAGMIGVNKGCFASGDTPWVGAKQSGYGFHGSAAGHRQFAQVRVLSRFTK